MAPTSPAGRSPTLDEVAALAGVGRGRVSRVLNDSPQVTEATRAAVRRAIETLGYVPHRAARSLVTRRTDSLAVVISESDSRVFTEPTGRRSGRAAMAGLLERGAAPDAVFVASDLMASGAMQVLAEHGLRVPDDVAVIGFDDSTVARHTRPQLTSVHQPVSAMGSQMAGLLLSAMRDGGTPESVVLPTRLVVRESA